jgi:C1A family cysteine protease
VGSWKDKDRVYQGGGGHAMVIVGYQKSGDRLFFKLRNSWGTEIGQGGYNIVEDTVLLPNLLEVTVLE